MSESRISKTIARLTEDAHRRREEYKADEWDISADYLGGKLKGKYYPATALTELEKYLRGDPQAEEKLNRMRQLMREKINRAVAEALYLLAHEEVPYLLLSESGTDAKRLRDFERRVFRHANGFARARLGIERRGRPAGWTKNKLEKAVKKAARAVHRQGAALTLRNVADEFTKQTRTEKLTEVNALKKLLGYYGVEWMLIKSAITKKGFRHSG